MWTPRRILLLFATLFGFGVVYAAYARFLGRIDGLPNLPAKYLESDTHALPEAPAVESPTIVRLREAFGDNCPEMGAAYPTRLEIREQGIVFAAGMPQIGSEPTKYVKLAPLSIATFAKPKLPHERVPGEVDEVSTLHADEGILEFDRPVASDRDMLTGKAKLIAIELRSNPDPHNTDPRNGRIVIGNNQKSADPARFFVMKTSGPVHYRTADHPESSNPALPHIFTTANVEIVNRENLPRQLRGGALPAVAVPSDDALLPGTVAEMALGLHTAPPTVTADGLKIFMKRDTTGKKAGYGGIREMILCENVLFSLWIDGSSGFPGSDAKAPAKAVKTDPPLATTGLIGGLHDGLATAERLKSRALLRVRTLGPFRYDLASNLARFDVAAQPNPLLPNNVEVMRFIPSGGKDTLVCQKLEIEFNGPVTGPSTGQGPGFKKLHASGTHVMIAAATEQLQATGTALTYETDAKTKRTVTTLHGAPLSAVRSRNVLIAGRPGTPAKLLLASRETNETDIAIDGPGRVELFEEATNEKTLTATWTKSLSQVRETIDGAALDRLVFTGDGEFIDAKGAFNLRGDVLKLWLKGGSGAESKSVPHRLQSLGHVSGLSADTIIENTDFLNVMFVDVEKPRSASPPPTVAVIPSGPPPIIQPVARSTEPKKPANPMRLAARVIDVTVHRMGEIDPKATPLYEMAEAHCTDRVIVLQPPNDPKKSPVGIDIRGGSLLMKKQGVGHVMTVNGTAAEIARVRFEGTTICGPEVVIDQPANSVNVKGGGWMTMPSSSSLAGAAVEEKNEITVHWQEKMQFFGERRWATFVGQVQAVQAMSETVVSKALTSTKSTVACHEMNVTFDKPIYFNQLNGEAKKAEGDPKIKTVVCQAAGQDEAPKAANLVLYLEETLDRVKKTTIKATQIEAKLLEVKVDGDLSHVEAYGPGTTRLLQMDAKDATPGAPPPPPNTKVEQEMKLTVVRFNGRLNLKDRKGIFQEAVFRENIRVARIPTENLNLVIDDISKPPPRSMSLKCNETFTVSSYKSKTPGGEDEKRMEAVDGAEIKTDDYIGMGHTITYDGTQIILRAFGDGQASLYRNERSIENRDYKSGNPLIYNLRTRQVSGANSSGGQVTPK